MDVLWIQCCMVAVLLVAANSQPLDVPISRNGSSETDKIPPVVEVINGSPVSHGTIPGLALLVSPEIGFCGGSLISQNFVLTAAHCFHSFDPADIPPLRIYFNTVNRWPLDSESVVRAIADYWIHPQYVTSAACRMSENDIALVRLDQPVRNLPFVPIATQVGNLVGKAATIYGFGISQAYDPSLGQPSPSPFMRQGELIILDKDTCAKTWKPQIVNEQYVCAIGTQIACRGDSGGPLISNGLQVGLSSFGSRSCDPQTGIPDIYTNVAVHAPWIHETIANALIPSFKP